MFKKSDEDPITVPTASATLSQATPHNVTLFNEKLFQVKLDNKLKDEIIILKEKVSKSGKVECDTTLLQASILKQQEKFYDVKMECFT